MENFINELKTNACSKTDYERKKSDNSNNMQEIDFFCNELKNSIMQYSLSESKKGNYVINDNIRYLCLRIIIHSQFDLFGNSIQTNNISTDYKIISIKESNFGLDNEMSWDYHEYKKIAPFGKNIFSDPLFPLCATIRTYTVDHATKIQKFFGKHNIIKGQQLISNDEIVFKMKDFFVESFGTDVDYKTNFQAIFRYGKDYVHAYRLHDIKIFF